MLCVLDGLFGSKAPFQSLKSSCWNGALFPLKVSKVCLRQGQVTPPGQVTLPSKSLHLDKSGFRRQKKKFPQASHLKPTSCFIMISDLLYFTVLKSTKPHLSRNKYIKVSGKQLITKTKGISRSHLYSIFPWEFSALNCCVTLIIFLR